MWIIDKIMNYVILRPTSHSVLLPYISIHMKSLGISVEETAIIHAVFPLFAIFAPYTMAIIADSWETSRWSIRQSQMKKEFLVGIYDAQFSFSCHA